mgnify:CR=1 FL=1
MALTKEVKIDKLEIVGDFKHVQCREATVVSEDGVELSRSFHRHVLTPSSCVTNGADNEDGVLVLDGTFTHLDTDISGEAAETQAICNAVWTDEVKSAWTAFQEAQAVPE